jgi:putative nucleotidyltransferase with HDIG domain
MALYALVFYRLWRRCETRMPHKSKLFIAFWIIFGLRLTLIFSSHNMIQFWIEIVFGLSLFLMLRYANQLFIYRRKRYITSLERITQLIERKLNTTNGHSTRVGRLTRQIAEKMKLNQEEIDAIHLAALLHDVGELQLEDRILNKRGPLTVKEEKQFRQHPEIGAKLVEGIVGFEKGAEYIRAHHEQWDGKGYPDGKSGKDIPLGARIIAAVNEYDYLMHRSKNKNPKQAFLNLSGTKLDPEIVQVGVQVVDFRSINFDDVTIEQVTEEKAIHEISEKFSESKLLRDFDKGTIVYYHQKQFFNMDGVPVEIPCEKQIAHLLSSGSGTIEPRHEYVMDDQSNKTYNVQWLTIGDKSYALIFDVSYLLQFEKKQKKEVFRIYRDVIFSVTQGKLLILEPAELKKYYEEEMVFEIAINEKQDVAKCRKFVAEFLDGQNIDGKKRYNILLALSEAVTNILKHAIDGKMKVYLIEDMFRIIVEDNGNGIRLRDLPKSTLLEGYSNKRSLGKGFAIMMKMMDRIAIYTSREGTTVILESFLHD